LFAARNRRVPSLWQRFMLVSPQAPNTAATARTWRWTDPHIVAYVNGVLRQLGDRAHRAPRVYGAGFSRGGKGIVELDGQLEPPFHAFAKIVTADAEDLSSLVRAPHPRKPIWMHVGGRTFPNIEATHSVCERDPAVVKFPLRGTSGLPPQSVVLTKRPQRAADDAHTRLCRSTFGDNRIYDWLLA